MISKTTLLRSVLQFRTNPLRTSLTLLGIVFGVSSVVAMVSIGEGAQKEILASIESMGANIVHIQAKEIDEEKIGDVINDSVGLSRSDISAILNVLPSIKRHAYRSKYSLNISSLPVSVHEIALLAVSRNIFDIHHLSLASGRKFTNIDHENFRRVIILGHNIARRSFPHGAVGEKIRLNYAYFEVIGVLEDRHYSASSLPVDPGIYDNAILIPYETANEELSPPQLFNEIDLLSLEVDTIKNTIATKKSIMPMLQSLHGNIEDYDVIAPEEILKQREATQSVLNIVLTSIAAISLIVGGIGVMNIMLANLMERVGEIGLRRAIGAKKSDIRNQFLLESVIVCFIGGIIGIILGFIISYLISFIVELPISFAWESMVLSFFISAVVGIIFGYLPAMRAANINPIEALQSE